MTISSNSLYGTSLGGTYGSSTSSSSSLSSQFAEALLTSMDSDGSGSVDSTEFSSAALALSTSDESVISDAFTSLDGDGDGEISVDELSSLFAQGAGMAAGGMPPPPPPSGSVSAEDTGYTAEEITALASEVSETDANLASLLTSISENFEAADANSDGKVTAAEAMAYQESTQGTTDSTEASTVSAAGGMPPPPPPPPRGEEDKGYTEEELLAMVDEVASTDSNLSSLFETLAANFDEADANGDGRVTGAEAMAYKDASKTESTTTATTSEATIADEDALMKALVAQIIANYSTQNSISGSSVSFSA